MIQAPQPQPFAHRHFAAELHRLGFALDPAREAPALVLRDTERRVRAAIVFRPSGAIDFAATLKAAEAAYAAHAAAGARLAEAEAIGRMFDRTRHAANQATAIFGKAVAQAFHLPAATAWPDNPLEG
ncbi:MAG: hypothetical protein ACOY6K_12505 [Pseudomonadota bacterium]